MTTTNLNAPNVSESQNSKEVTINEMGDAIDRATQDSVDIAVTGNTTVSAAVYTRNFEFNLTGTPAAAFNLDVPNTRRFFLVNNGTNRTATVQVTGGAGAGVEIAAGQARLLYSDNADIIEAGGGGGGGASAFTGLSDTPSGYTGLAGQVFRVNAAENALEAVALPYDFGALFEAEPAINTAFSRLIVARDITVPANFAGSSGTVGTNPASSYAIDVKDDGVSIGTITVGTDGAFTFATTGGNAQAIAAGSLIEFDSPGTLDNTIADLLLVVAATQD